MKTLLKTTALTATLTLLLSISLNASTYNFNDELYIDDIPFNTTEIYNDIMVEKELAEFNYEEEGYIDDIPFETECVTLECLYHEAVRLILNMKKKSILMTSLSTQNVYQLIVYMQSYES